MSEDRGREADPEQVKAWLHRAEINPRKCFLCYRIWVGNQGRRETLRPIQFAGMTLSREMQMSHLGHCIGGTGGA